MTNIVDVEGIGEAYSAKLDKAGIATIEKLLKRGANKKGRKEIAKQSDISEKMILEWVNRADLSRVSGVGTQYADLLEFSGVDSVPELAVRNPEALCNKMSEVNDLKHLVRRAPTLTEVNKWVVHAKSLPRIVTH